MLALYPLQSWKGQPGQRTVYQIEIARDVIWQSWSNFFLNMLFNIVHKVLDELNITLQNLVLQRKLNNLF